MTEGREGRELKEARRIEGEEVMSHIKKCSMGWYSENYVIFMFNCEC